MINKKIFNNFKIYFDQDYFFDENSQKNNLFFTTKNNCFHLIKIDNNNKFELLDDKEHYDFFFEANDGKELLNKLINFFQNEKITINEII